MRVPLCGLWEVFAALPLPAPSTPIPPSAPPNRTSELGGYMALGFSVVVRLQATDIGAVPPQEHVLVRGRQGDREEAGDGVWGNGVWGDGVWGSSL